MSDQNNAKIITCGTPGCNTKLKIVPKPAASRVRCPSCKQVIEVPAESAPGIASETTIPAAPAQARVDGTSVPSNPRTTPDGTKVPSASAAPAPSKPAVAARSASATTGPRQFMRVPEWIEWVTNPRPKMRTAFRWTLLVSLAVHLSFTPLASQSGALSPEQMKNLETEYGKKIDATKSAGVVARNLAGKITAPPPPPDPEGVVTDTLNQALTTDIEKVVGNLLDVKVTSKLASQVAASLKDDLKAVAKDIVEGKLTEDQIKELHKKFQSKAHQTAVAALREHRIETQEERAAANTTEWYENSVSRTLSQNLTYDLFHRMYGRYRWHGLYTGSVYKNYSGYPAEWGFMGYSGYENKIQQLAGLQGEAKKKAANPGKEQAEFVAKRLQEIFDITKSFSAGVTFDQGFQNYVKEYYPHREAEVRGKYADKLAELWKNANSKAGAYVTQTESGISGADLQAGQTACFDAIRDLAALAGEVIPKNARDYTVINQVVRSRVMRNDVKDQVYKYWVDEMVSGLDPLIREFAQDQFKAGKIAQKEGFQKAMDDFPKQILPLLRRDMQALIPLKKFNTMVFEMNNNPYRSKVTNVNSPPDEKDIAADEAALAKILSANSDLKAFAEKREQVVAEEFKASLERVKEKLLELVLTGSLLLQNMSAFVEGVDYADNVQEKLDARASALKGRGQDLANLTADGVPDTSAPLVTLMIGGRSGQGASLEPVLTNMLPGYMARSQPIFGLRGTRPQFPRDPGGKKAVLQEQAKIPNPFAKSPRFEAIPFLAKFPRLDGDLSDWGETRPLILQAGRGSEPILVRAAWNYQGFFFGYEVKQPVDKYYYPTYHAIAWNLQIQAGTPKKAEGCNWAFRGDYFRLLFDTLDARNANRGEPHTQEFIVLPMGTDSDANAPGLERMIKSQRDAKSKEYRAAKDTPKVFPQQPSIEQGPDGSGPYRVTRMSDSGYTVELFLPRSTLNVPVFAPGWFIGFDCTVATGFQAEGLKGQVWAAGYNRYDDRGNHPESWGDLLLLGTDARVMLHQNTDGKYEVAEGVVPGHSYLLTVIDPDRNVNPGTEDTILVSAEATGGNTDVEVFILKETDRNSGMFRGYIDTQPGRGREVQGTLEVLLGQELVLGYVDFGNARGERNVRVTMKLPVVGSVMAIKPKGD